MDERQAVAGQLLQDEALAAEEAGAELLLECDADADALGGAEKRILLADHRVAVLLQIQRNDPPGVGGRKGNLLLPGGRVAEERHEERLAGQHPLAGAQQRTHDAAPLLARAVAEDGLHLDAGIHVHEGARLGDARLARVERQLDELHLLAEDLVVDLVGSDAERRHRRRRRRQHPGEFGLLGDRHPGAQPLAEDVRVATELSTRHPGLEIVFGEGSLLLARDCCVPDLVATHDALSPPFLVTRWGRESTNSRSLLPYSRMRFGPSWGTRSRSFAPCRRRWSRARPGSTT